MVKRLTMSVLFLFVGSSVHASCVILLHGLLRSSDSMAKLEDRLKSEDYQVVNVDYPSRQSKIRALANKAIVPALKQCKPGDDIHFVTHSLGGILVRQYLSEHEIPKLKHVVMLGPPNQGSEIVDELEELPGFAWINGPAGLELGTSDLSAPNRLGSANFDVGVVAGNFSVNLLLSSIIPGDDDGKVSVERTRLEGMNDHITLPVSHPFLMKNSQVIDQVLFYLSNGYFNHVP